MIKKIVNAFRKLFLDAFFIAYTWVNSYGMIEIIGGDSK